MNITLLRLKGVVQALHGIQKELERMNDMRERELAYTGVHMRPPQADTSGPEPDTLYTNEETDFFREMEEELGKREKKE